MWVFLLPSSIIKSKRINRDMRACGILSELVVYTSYQNTAADQHLQRWEQLGTAGTGPEWILIWTQEWVRKLTQRCNASAVSQCWGRPRDQSTGWLCWCESLPSFHRAPASGTSTGVACVALQTLHNVAKQRASALHGVDKSTQSEITIYWLLKVISPKVSARQLFCKAASSLSLCGIFWP